VARSTEPRSAIGRAALERHCSVGRTLALLSDPWSFLVLREAYLGARRFGQIRAVLGLPRATLGERLGRLVAAGLLRRAVAPGRADYRLTEAGIDLYLVMLALLRFGDDWLAGGRAPPLTLVHAGCGEVCRPLTVCSACREPIAARAVRYRDGPGAGAGPAPGRRSRRAGDAAQYERGRPSSVARALGIVGDRWSFLVIREACFGVRRFDGLQTRLGIAPNILADRLGRLVADGLLERRRYQALPARYEYRLTGMGHALYLPLIQMLRWGDRWLAPDGPPLLLTHRTCGQDFQPLLVCDRCGEPVTARQMRYRLNYPHPAPPAGAAAALVADVTAPVAEDAAVAGGDGAIRTG
jgi:DNA-binding HxlR family transcriptional regulator